MATALLGLTGAALGLGVYAMSAGAVNNPGTLTLDKQHYSATESPTLTLTDSDLDSDPMALDTANVTLASTADPAGIAVTLRESGLNTGVFNVAVPSITFSTTATSDAFNTLWVAAGDTLTATYTDVSPSATVVATATMYADTATAGLNATRYRTSDTATLTVNDLDRNTSATSAQSFTVKFSSTSSATGVTVTLTETGNNSNTFTGTATFNTIASTGTSLHVAQGDTVTLTYEEPEFSGGADTETRTATATMNTDGASAQVGDADDVYLLADTATLSATDADANADPAMAETVTANLKSTTHAAGVTVTLTESGVNTGVFNGTATFNATASSGTSLLVAGGDVVTLTYNEPAFAGGTTARTDTTRIAHNATVALDKPHYRTATDNQTATVTVTDFDRNTTTGTAQTVTAKLTSATSDPTTGVTVTLTETGANTGIFSGTAGFGTADSSGTTLKVAVGEVVTATYTDALVFTGASDAARTATAAMYADTASVTLNKTRYHRDETATITVTDADRNQNATSAETVSVAVKSDEDATGFSVTLNENAANSGVFTGTVTFNTTLSNNPSLKVAAGNAVTVTYAEPNFAGTTTNRTASATMRADTATAALDDTVYGVGDTATLTVTDADRNLDPAAPDTVSATFTSTSDSTGLTLTLTETGNATGIFSRTATFTEGASTATALKIAAGDIVTLSYSEPTFANGTASKTDSARMAAAGVVTLDQNRYRLGETVTLTVTDADLNTDSGTVQSVSVNLKSTSHPAGITVLLTEDDANDSVFDGTATFTTGASNDTTDALQVAPGDTVTVTYNDTTTLDGEQDTLTATAVMYTDGATATLDKTRYQRTETATITVNDVDRNSSPTTAQTVTANLKSSSDAMGRTITLTETDVNTGIFSGTATFNTTLSSGSSLFVAAGDLVTLTYEEPVFATFTTTAQTDDARMYTDSATAEVGDADDVYISTNTATLKVTDVDRNLDPAVAETVSVNFKSTSDATGITVTLTEEGVNDSDFLGTATFTSGPSSGSTLKAASGDTLTITYAEPTFAGATTDRTDTARMAQNGTASFDKLHYRLATDNNTATLTVNDADLNTNTGLAETVVVNLKSTLDATGLSVTLTETGNNTGIFTNAGVTFNTAASTGTSLRVAAGNVVTMTYAESTTLDNVAADRVATATMYADTATVTLDKTGYGVGETATITVNDVDRNQNATSAESVQAKFVSSTDPTGRDITLNETGVNTGVFSGTATFTGTGLSSGTTLRVASGDTVTATYQEPKFDGTGTTARTASSAMYVSGTAGLGASRYDLDDTPTLTVADADLNTNGSTQQTVQVLLTSTADATGVPVTLTETAVNSGSFTGTAAFTSGGSFGSTLKVAPGNTVTMTYQETTRFSGAPVNHTSTATITTSGSAVLDKTRYDRNDTATVTVTDPDLNTNAGSAQTVAVNLKSSADTTGISLTLTETGNATGIFTGNATFTTVASSGSTLKVADGGSVTLTYAETTTFEGPAADRTDTATMFADTATAALDAEHYAGTDTTTMTVNDADGNLDPAAVETVSVNLKSTADATGIAVTLNETGADTGIFTGTATFTTGATNDAADTLKIAGGDTVTLTYNEPNAAGGGTVARTDTATVNASGSATLDDTTYQLTDTATLTVSDDDLDTDAGTAQTVPVNLKSTSDTTGITVTLTETGVNSGVFSATAGFVTGSSTGTNLKVASGDTVTLTYEDAVSLAGPPATVTDAATMRTNAAAALDKLRYQRPETATLTVTDPDLNTDTATKQQVNVALKSTSDATGITVDLQETGNSTGIFTGPVTFSTVSSADILDQLRAVEGDTVTLTYNEPTTSTFEGPAAARTATATMFADTATATFNQARYQRPDTATLTVTDIDRNSSTSSPQSVIVNLKSTTDATGVSVTLNETGNDTGVFTAPVTFATGASNDAADTLKVAAGDTVTLTYSESRFDGTSANVMPTATMHAAGTVAFDKARYQRAETATVTVTDADLNTGAGSAETVAVNLKSSSDGTGIGVTLTETGNNTGIFSGTATFTTGTSNDATNVLKVAAADTLTSTYGETTTFDGIAADRTASSVMDVDGSVALNQAKYQADQSPTITVTDADLNDNAGTAQTVSVNLKSTSDGTGIGVTLTETGVDTGVFAAPAAFTTGASNDGTDTLKVAAGDTITATYAEATTFEGPAADRTATAKMDVNGAVALDNAKYQADDSATITVTDADPNTDAATAQTVSVNLKSTSDATGITVSLTETGVDTGVFAAPATFTTGASNDGTDTLKVAAGDTITATYAEATTFEGPAADRTATAKMDVDGSIALDKANYQADETATITVTDADLNTDATTAQDVAVTLKSTADATGITVSLTETGVDTGIFSDTAAFTTGASNDGTDTLKVGGGDTVTATYAEATTFAGPAANRTATATTYADSGSVALNKAKYQGSEPATITVTDADPNTNPTTAQTVVANLKSTADATGINLTLTETGVDTGIFSAPAAFTTGASNDGTDTLKVAAGDTVTATYAEPTLAGTTTNRTATATMFTDGATATLNKAQYQASETATLTVTDGDRNASATTADQVAAVLKSGADATGINVTLTESGINTGIFSGTATFTTASSNDTTDVLKVAGGNTVTLTYAEPTFTGPTVNRTATATMFNDSATVALDKATYQANETATLTVTDADKNSSATTAETMAANLKSTADATGINVTLTETGVNTGVFTGTATFTTAPSNDTTDALKVAGGNTVTLTYSEPNLAGTTTDRVTTAAMATNGTSALDKDSYVVADTANLTVTDTDLNTDPATAQSIAVNLKSSTGDATGISVTLTETGVNTGVFTGTATFTTGTSNDAADTLKVAVGDTVTSTFAETLTFEGPAANRTDTATIAATPVPTTITLSPSSGSSTTGTSVTFTASVKDQNAAAFPGVTVRFSVAGANSAGGSATTNASGNATFAYTGSNAGTDTITAYADTNGDSTRTATTEPQVTASRTWTAPTVPPVPPAPTKSGYWLTGTDGRVFAFGDAAHHGDLAGVPTGTSIVGIAGTTSQKGYWLVGANGAVWAFGDAQSFGSMAGKALQKPIVGIAVTPTGKGYWMVATDGGIFAFGDATFLGSMGGKPLNKPMVGIASTPTGKGYWTVATDGGIFAFGDATFLGSMGGKPLNKPVVGMTAVTRTDAPQGYRLVASDGGIFSYGAPFYGSLGSTPLNQPITGMSTVPSGQGYRLVAADGGVFNYGPDAPAKGSAASVPKSASVTAMAGF